MDPILRFLKPAARELDPEAARDRYRGAMLGLAVGNMLGCPVEGFAAADIQEVLPGGVRDIHPIELGKPWDDDVAQAIDLAESLLEGDFDPDAYLQKLLLWWEAGGRGIGRQTLQVLIRAKAGVRGTDAAWAVWEQSGRQAAGNGAVMRCAPVGLRWRRDPVRLVQDAGMQTRATHYDPRCVWTATATCAALAHAVAGSHWTLHELADGLSAVGTPAEVTDAVRHAATATLAELELDEPYSMGYTVKAMKAGLWAFINADSFTETVLQVVNAGGDTDTNGAVAGAVLGARF
ncbi:MAG TPA: ADP-ribosylglycohydrolase family protein, partial [Gemmatimonadota bacterium]|nr:ADP-ribosylglycohydrolase family protein [Gemmatimonadota bacterium]